MVRFGGIKQLVLIATIVGTSMTYIDGVADNVALPAIQAEFGARLSDLQWVDQAYTLCIVAFLLVGGALGDRFGQKRIFVFGVVAFVVTSALGGVTQNISQLIVVRALQGLSAAILVPGSLALITQFYKDKDRGPAIGIWWAFSVLMVAVALLFGGFLIQNVSWRAIFFMNIPLGVLVLLLLTRVPNLRLHSGQLQGDWLGAVLATAGLGGIVFALIEQSNRGLYDPLVIGAFVIGVALLGVFVYVERRVQNPIMPPSLFRSRTFTAASLILLGVNGTLAVVLFFMPLNLIQVQGYPAGLASAGILPVLLAVFLISRWAGGLAIRFGPRPPILVGTVVAALGFILLGQQGIGKSYWLGFFPALCLIGTGLALILTPITIAGMAAVKPAEAGVGSAILNTTARVSNLALVTLLVAVLVVIFTQSLTAAVQSLHLPPEIAAEVMAQRNRLTGAEPPQSADAQTQLRIEHAINESFVSGFRTVAYLCAGIMGLCAVGTLALIGKPQREAMQEALHAAPDAPG